MVKYFGSHPQSLAKRGRSDGHDHEFLQIDVIVGVRAAVEDVHHGYRQRVGCGAAEIAIEGEAAKLSGSFSAGQRCAEYGVGTQAGLIGGAIEVDHRLVDLILLGRV